MHYRFRFSIGQLMGLIAVSALLIANAVFATQGNFTFHTMLAAAIILAGLGVLLYNRRLSRWMWVWIAGQSGPLLVMTLQPLLNSLFFSFNFVALALSLYLVCSVLTLVGLTMTLRDIRRKLAMHENAFGSEAEGSTGPTH
jgi:hypothetical protein